MQDDLITPDLCIDEIFTRWPETVLLFLEHRMACVGCSMSAFDTLEEALKVYGLPRADTLQSLNEFLGDEKLRKETD